MISVKMRTKPVFGKDFIYTRVLLRCVLVGSLCSDNVLELEAGCG